MSDNVTRAAHNLCVMPACNGTMTNKEVDEYIDRFGTELFCNGEMRSVIFTPITKNHYKFHSEPLK